MKCELTNPIKKTTSYVREGTSSNVHFHDPSNILKFDGSYFVWFTRNLEDQIYASSYFAVSTDGIQWEIQGEALPLGNQGDWDDSGNLAPYVALVDDHFYLFYTGFTNKDLSTRHWGLARAKTPWGPWVRFKDEPVLCHGQRQTDWHSNMVGDSNAVFREGKWWLYFKGKKDLMRCIPTFHYSPDMLLLLGNTEGTSPPCGANTGQKYCGLKMG